MKSKGFVALIASILLLGGYAIYDYQIEKSEQNKKTEAAKLMTFNKDQINEIVITKEGSRVHLKKDVDGWMLLEPVQDLADNEGVDIFISTATSENSIDVVKEGADVDWALYGLDKPMGTVEFKVNSGESQKFEVSSKKNFEQNTFIRKNSESKVVVASGTWQARLNKGPIEFRDRRFLRHRIASVDQVKIETADKTLELKNVDNKWQIPGDKKVLDQNKVREILQKISDAKVADFLVAGELTEASRKKYLLAKPASKLTLIMADKKWEAGLWKVGPELFAYIQNPPFLYRLETGVIEKILETKKTDLYETDKNLPEGTTSTKSVSDKTAPEKK